MKPVAEQAAVTSLWDQLRGARLVDLSHPYQIGMPQSPNHPPFRMVIERRHGDIVRADGGSAANELLILGGHVGTHVDALAHVSQDGKLYGGIGANDLLSHRGFASMGIDTVPPFAGRAIILDVAAVHGVSCLPPGYEISPADLEAALNRAGAEPRPGDFLIVGTGWSRRWSEHDTFIGQQGGVPGPGLAAGVWLADHRPALVGAESIAFEHIPPGQGHASLPVHRLMLTERGINIVETLNLAELLNSGVGECAVLLAALKIAGASGAPARPIALLPAQAESTGTGPSIMETRD